MTIPGARPCRRTRPDPSTLDRGTRPCPSRLPEQFHRDRGLLWPSGSFLNASATAGPAPRSDSASRETPSALNRPACWDFGSSASVAFFDSSSARGSGLRCPSRSAAPHRPTSTASQCWRRCDRQVLHLIRRIDRGIDHVRNRGRATATMPSMQELAMAVLTAKAVLDIPLHRLRRASCPVSKEPVRSSRSMMMDPAAMSVLQWAASRRTRQRCSGRIAPSHRAQRRPGQGKPPQRSLLMSPPDALATSAAGRWNRCRSSNGKSR